MTSQPYPASVVHRDMNPENIILEAARRERLTRAEREREDAYQVLPDWLRRKEETMNEYAKISKRQALKAIHGGAGQELDGMARMLGGLPRAAGESDDSVRDQVRMLLEAPSTLEDEELSSMEVA